MSHLQFEEDNVSTITELDFLSNSEYSVSPVNQTDELDVVLYDGNIFTPNYLLNNVQTDFCKSSNESVATLDYSMNISINSMDNTHVFVIEESKKNSFIKFFQTKLRSILYKNWLKL